MRLLKIGLSALVAGLAMLAGLVVAAVAAVGALLFFFSRRPRGKKSLDRPAPLGETSSVKPNPLKRDSRDVIDVIATEVPVDAPKH